MIVKVSDLRIGKIKYDCLFLNNYLLENRKENRRITNSPHYKLLVGYEKNPDLNLKNTDYFKFAKSHMDYFDNWFGYKNEDGIISHIKQFLELYEDIKKNGFDYSKDKIIIFKTVINTKSVDKYGRPHPPTKTYIPEDYEIYEGHHRATILAKLGYEEVEVETYSKLNILKNKILKLITKYNGKLRFNEK